MSDVRVSGLTIYPVKSCAGIDVDAVTVTVLTSNRVRQPYGAAGGEPGQSGRNAVRRADGSRVALAGNDQIELEPGDVFVMDTPGGGGYGAPD